MSAAVPIFPIDRVNRLLEKHLSDLSEWEANFLYSLKEQLVLQKKEHLSIKQIECLAKIEKTVLKI